MQFSKLLKIIPLFYIAFVPLEQLDCLCKSSGYIFMKQIKLTRGMVALVDDDIYDFLNQWKWRAHKGRVTFYANRTSKVSDGIPYSKRHTVLMHRVIMGVSNPSLLVDHKDYNGLNNQRGNLRVCTVGENNRHRRSAKNSSSKYLGVSFCKEKGLWAAAIFVNSKQKRLGRFKKEKDAAIAYNNAAKLFHGEFANLNQV